jgi:cholesterol 25-hydroxylase
VELVTAVFIYDALFFFIHIASHRIPFLARIHRPQHTHAEIHLQVTNRLSFAERLSLVLLANFSLNIIGSHVLMRTAFVPFFVGLLIDVHSGLDLTWGYDKILPFGMGGCEPCSCDPSPHWRGCFPAVLLLVGYRVRVD